MFKTLLTFWEYSQFDPLSDWLRVFIVHNGIFAPILLLTLDESGIPLPIPGDLYISFTGYLISKGSISYPIAFFLLLASILIGSSILFYLSSRYGQVIVLKFGQYIHLDEKKLLMVENKFRKYGIWVIIFGRHIPGFRVPITVFSGMSGISYKKFIFATFVSVVFWILFYLSLGQRLGNGVFILLRGNSFFFILFTVPFIMFFGSIIYIYIKSHIKKDGHKK